MSADPVSAAASADEQTILYALDHAAATADVSDDENLAELREECIVAAAALARLAARVTAAEQARDEAQAWRDVAAAEQERLRKHAEGLATALRTEHEERCGCDAPGRTAYCVAGPNFSALDGPLNEPEQT